MNTLFIVDDDTIYQRIMKMTLIKYPVFKNVTYFSGGQQILQYLRENKDDFSNLPDVIFLDIFMPDVDGWEVLNTLHSLYDSLCKKIDVYVVSVCTLERDKQRALNYAFVKDFIPKPFGKDTLIAISEDVNRSVLIRTAGAFYN